nr:GDSL-like Lipase/Acylhydrolase family [uncultured bacterium]
MRLGDNFSVVEEGLNGRTTDLDQTNRPGRNGKTYLAPCLASHDPIDTVVLILGTNDLRIEFHRSAQETANAIKNLVADIHQYTSKVLLVSPIHIDDHARDFELYAVGRYDATSAAKSRELADCIKSVAQELDCAFFDASTVAAPGNDGIHLDAAAHRALAEALEKLLV